MLVLLAFGRNVAVTFIPRAAVAVAAVVAVIALLAVGFLGYLPAKDGSGGAFLRNFRDYLPAGAPGGMLSGGTVWLMDLFIGVMLGAYVFAMLTALSTFHSRRRHDPGEPKEE